MIIVEDGSIVTDANSYVTVAELNAYVAARGTSLTSSGDTLLIKAMDYIESQRFIGTKSTSGQSLQWPRLGAYVDGFAVPSNEIPKDLKNAQMATAVSIDLGYDPLATIERAVKREEVDVLEVEYMDNAASSSIIQSIGASLNKLLLAGGQMSVWRV